MTTRIIGTGSAVPKRTVTNEELSEFLDTSDEWIRSRSGIGERQIAGKDENVVSLASEAGRKALEDSKIAPEEIQLLLVATCSSEYHFPSAACQVQAALGLSHAAAMDISAACSGFLFALHTAHAYISAGIYEKVLVIGADTLSKIIDWEDRSTCVLFGDGAGACVVQADEEGLIDFQQYSDGNGGNVLIGAAATLKTPAAEAEEAKPLAMEGQAVFKFAVKTIPESVRKLLAKTNTEIEDVKYFVLHQANSRIIRSAARHLGVPEEKFVMNMEKHGNTTAASIPILLDEMNRNKMLKKGDLLLLSAFGAGLTWGAALLRW